MKVIEPLTMRELLTDQIYRPYILKTPRLPAGCRSSAPWRVWGLRTDDKWAGKNFPDYASAFDLVKRMLKAPDKYSDVSLICRPTGFGPPAGYVVPPLMEWCGHCRRPTIYRRSRNHPAMRKWPVISDEDVLRCYYCAARQPQHRWYH